MKTFVLAAALALGSFAAGPVLAEDAAPAATTMAKPDAAAKAAKAQECSKEADAKNLHGKPRKIFREKCKKGEM